MDKTDRRLQSLKKRKQQLGARIDDIEARQKTKKRKQRTRDLIQIGGLVDIAGLRDMDRDALLGALVYLSKHLEKNPKQIPALKKSGEEILKARQRKKDRSRS